MTDPQKPEMPLVEEVACFISTNQEDWEEANLQAQSIITHVLSAVRNGRLDEQMGVVGRGFIERTINEDRVWWAEGVSALERYPEVDFIALSPAERKEEDMPKELLEEITKGQRP